MAVSSGNSFWGGRKRVPQEGSKVFSGHSNVVLYDSLVYSPGKGTITDSLGRQFLKGVSSAVPVH